MQRHRSRVHRQEGAVRFETIGTRIALRDQQVGLKQLCNRCVVEPCVYYHNDDEKIVFLLVYADDVICATNEVVFKCSLCKDLDKMYDLKDQGFLTNYLGVKICQSDDGAFIG